jgi:hypothetical protein
MTNILPKRSVSFRDKNKNRWTVTVEFRKMTGTHKDKNLFDFEGGFEVSFSAEGGCSCGQCVDSIVPRTEAQQSLVDYWKRYHLNGQSAGTNIQEAYLLGKYEEDVKWLQDLIDEYKPKYNNDTELRANVAPEFLKHFFGAPEDCTKVDRYLVVGQDIGNGFSLYELVRRTIPYLDAKDLYTKMLFLLANGILWDRDYKYGSGWLYEQISDGVRDEINIIFDMIVAEEQEYTESLVPVFDMGDEDFHPNHEIIDKIIELTGYDEYTALRFLALGMYLGCTFGDLNDTFEPEGVEECVYSANGISYYIGTEEELEEIARIQLHESYREIWVDECTNGGCNDSFHDWCEDVLSLDGFASILNHWDGRSNETHLPALKETLYICRQ